MKKYYFISTIAAAAIICLLALHINSLYGNFRTKTMQNIRSATHKALSLENHLAQTLKEKDSILFNNNNQFEISKLEQADLRNLIEGSDIASLEDITLLLHQEHRLQSGEKINLYAIKVFLNIQLGEIYDAYITLNNTNSAIIDSIGNPSVKENYKLQKIKIGSKDNYSLSLYFDIPASNFLKESTYILITLVVLMTVILLIIILLLTTIRRKQRTIEFREKAINGVIHDLKTPLAAVTTMTSLLKMSEADPTKASIIANSLLSLNKLSTRINSMLSVAKSDRIAVFKGEYTFEELAKETKQTIDNITNHYRAKDNKNTSTTIKYSGFKADTKIFLDKIHWDSIITNLVDNAIKYSPQNPTLEININVTENNTLELSVTDQGIGISKFQQLFIFKEFYRAPALKNLEEGVGVGLSYLRIITKAHGGKISVRSSKKTGSTFLVTINTLEQ